RLWAGTAAGLAQLSGASWHPYPFDCLGNNLIGKIALSPDGTVWAAPAGYVDSLTHGLLVNVLRGGTWRSYPNPCAGDPVTSLLTDGGGTAWCGLGWWDSALRMFIVRIDAGGADTIITTPPLPQRCGVGASYLDPAGNKYFSAYSNEAMNYVVRFSPAGAVTFLLDPSPVGSYSNYMWIISIAKDHDGALWLGSYYNDLTRCDEAAGTWSHFGTEAGLPNVNIRSIAVGDDNSLWLATAQGLCRGRYDGATGRLAVTTWNTGNSRILSDDVRTVRLDRRGNAWIATAQGLSQRTWDGRWVNYTVSDIDRNGSMLLSDDVNDIAVYPQNEVEDDIWVATSKGLNLLRYIAARTSDAADCGVAPNPFDPDRDRSLVFSRLPDRATVRIYTIDGRLVGVWHGPAAPAHQLALRAGSDFNTAALPSGLYLCHISAPGASAAVIKLAIIR
ncbi:MAG TPA: two-component regulator propeller domain-containing protein, partial [Candidatus Edwardsbacteria bacterium]|nr:two-component regulator propeller domain-containing protein [Candidatus Edwardsbacteria bacterium]